MIRKIISGLILCCLVYSMYKLDVGSVVLSLMGFWFTGFKATENRPEPTREYALYALAWSCGVSFLYLLAYGINHMWHIPFGLLFKIKCFAVYSSITALILFYWVSREGANTNNEH